MAVPLPSDGNMFTPKAEPISDLLSGIHSQKTALPNFQRPWVWEPSMVRELLISVAYRYPAGSLLTMPVSSMSFALRSFEGVGESLRERPNLMVLDGQQRLTSLYQALYRREGVQYNVRAFHFYLDVPRLFEGGSFADALFFVVQEKRGKRVRYDGLRPLYELTTRAHELAVGALPLNLLFDANDALANWRQDYLVHLSGQNMPQYLALHRQWDSCVGSWLTNIKTYPFPVVQLRADMPLGAICHIFEKVNSSGVELDVFDLCTAILWAQNFHLNEEWKKTAKQLERAHALDMQPHPLSGTYFLQGIALLESMERKRASTTGRVAVSCRKEDLMRLGAETVSRLWKVMVDGSKEASKFMLSQGILAERILPYTTLIIPLSAIFADLLRRKGAAYLGATYPKIAQWYWCSVFSQRYSSQVESAASLDFEQVLGWLEGGDMPEVVRTFSFRSEALQEISSIRNAMYKGVLCLLARNHARDFGGSGTLSIALFSETAQDHHHIFPTEALKRLQVSDARANTIVNKTLISAAVNRSIQDQLPSVYVGQLSARLGMETTNDIPLSHAVNPTTLRQDNWEAFVLDRRERLRALVEEACGGSVHPFGAADEEGPVLDLTEPEDVDDEVLAS